MKKFLILLTTLILLVTVTATFASCSDKDYSDLKDRMDKIEEEYNALKERVEKLETTISLLETVGDSAEFIELKNKVNALQSDLINNSANDTQIKSQVTQMQLTLDKISDNDNVDNEVLKEIQSKLNTLYGEVDRVLQFENGKEYEVKLNGVVYFTVSILLEYHDGIVKSEQDIKECVSNETHICGSIYVKNLMSDAISLETMESLMQNCFDNNRTHSTLIGAKKGFGFSNLEKIESMSEGRWYFYVKPNNSAEILIEETYNILFKVPNSSLIILKLNNVWGDENGLKPPIIGTKD